MNRPASLWRRLWAGLPLTYKLVLFGLCTIMTATLAVMVVTYSSAGESLKLQLERQVSRDLNVLEKWYRARLEEMQLTSVGLARHVELDQAVVESRLGAAAPLLDAELRRLQVDLALLVDRNGRLIGPAGARGTFDPNGIVSRAIERREQIVATESWAISQLAALPVPMRQPGLVRLVVTPLGGERVDSGSPVPAQVTSMIGGAIGVLDMDQVVAGSGFPEGRLPQLSPAVWADARAGRYFFSEQDVAGRPYMLAFRPVIDHQGRTVGAFVRGYPQAEITETLHRYAGGIFMLTAAAVVFSLLAFLWLTRQLLFPLRRLANISVSLAAGGQVDMKQRVTGNDELARLERGVAKLADRLTQSREELAEAAVKLEVEAQALAERNAQLAGLNDENARLLAAIRDHDRLRGQLIEKIITAQEDERKRIARELHDETGQSLTGLLVGLKFVEGAQNLDDMRLRTADLKALAVQTLEEVHKLSVALRPAMLDDLGLAVAVRSLVKDFGSHHGLKAEFLTEGLDQRLPPLWEVTLYRIVQEALTNAGKYADASRVTVRFVLEADRLTATIEDDGVGFDPAAIGRDGREHLGLLGMRERIALIGGEFQLTTAPGAGTRVAVTAAL
ncbi:MAG: ATP-binding protein, partial [Candidatus Sericytochromatia bacterium]